MTKEFNGIKVIVDEKLVGKLKTFQSANKKYKRCYMLSNEWKVTGICPECEKRSISGGRCIECGWESKGVELFAEAAEIIERGRARMNESNDPEILAMNPTEKDWLTSEELEKVHSLELEALSYMESIDDIRKRVKKKRKARRIEAFEESNKMNIYKRKIEVFYNKDWVEVSMSCVCKGDTFRMFEPSGEQVKDKDGNLEFVATSNAYIGEFGVFEVEVSVKN